MPNQIANLDRIFHALSDPTRRAIVSRLSHGPATVSELAKPHAMSMPSLLQHLDVLEECRLVRTEKSGRVRTCQMRASGLGAAGDWIAAQRAIWKGRLDRMETYVASLKRKEKKHAKGPEPK